MRTSTPKSDINPRARSTFNSIFFSFLQRVASDAPGIVTTSTTAGFLAANEDPNVGRVEGVEDRRGGSSGDPRDKFDPFQLKGVHDCICTTHFIHRLSRPSMLHFLFLKDRFKFFIYLFLLENWMRILDQSSIVKRKFCRYREEVKVDVLLFAGRQRGAPQTPLRPPSCSLFTSILGNLNVKKVLHLVATGFRIDGYFFF